MGFFITSYSYDTMLFVMSKTNKPIQKFCIVCGSPTEFKIPEGDNKERAVCTVCGHIHYQNPKGCIRLYFGMGR